MKRLGRAIDESLSESDSIAEVIGDIKKEGYDVLLVLEATIGFREREEKAADAEADQGEPKDLVSSLTPQDQKFLKALSITLDS